MPSWVNRTVLSGSSVNENGTSSHTCTFAAATSGNFLVAIITGSVTSSTPAGWTLQQSMVGNTGLYVFTKSASSGESSFSTTHNSSNYAIQGVVYEFPAGSSYVNGNSELGQEPNTTELGPQVTGLTGTYTRFSARSWCTEFSNTSTSCAWTIPSIEDYDVSVPKASNDGVSLTIAYDDMQTASSFDPSSVLTTVNNVSITTSEGIAFALNVQTTPPFVSVSNNANGGTNSANVTYYNSGETSGDPWDYINIGTNASITFSNQYGRGVAYRFATGATSTQALVEWQKLITPVSTAYIRFNVFLPTYTSASTRFCELNDGSSVLLTIGIRSDGILSIRDSAGAQMALTTIPLPVGRWCRIEFMATASPTAGQIVLRTFREVDSPYPTERVTSAASFNTQPGANGILRVRFGITGINIANTTYFMDDFAMTDAGFPGPAEAAVLAPLFLRNGAETGTNGATITSASTGNGVNASLNVVRGAAPVTFSNAQSAHGLLSYYFQPVSGDETFVIWSRLATSSAALRAYFYFTGLPGLAEEIAQLTTTDSGPFSALARFVLTPANKLRVVDASDATLWTSTASLTINTWYRLEMFAQLGGTATAGTINAAFYALDNVSAIESFSTSAANLGTTNFGFVRIGKVASASSWASPFYVDDIAVQQQASGFIGPYTAPPAAPVVYPGITPHLGWGRSI